jgi:hypothetical protein
MANVSVPLLHASEAFAFTYSSKCISNEGPMRFFFRLSNLDIDADFLAVALRKGCGGSFPSKRTYFLEVRSKFLASAF